MEGFPPYPPFHHCLIETAFGIRAPNALMSIISVIHHTHHTHRVYHAYHVHVGARADRPGDMR
jgi:hypothetical protein